MKQLYLLVALLFATLSATAADIQKKGSFVTIHPDGGEAKVIRLQVVNDNIIRVQATCEEALPQKAQSLMIVEQKEKPQFIVEEDIHTFSVKAKNVTATINKSNGNVTFFDA